MTNAELLPAKVLPAELLPCPFCGGPAEYNAGWGGVGCLNLRGECPVEPCTPEYASDAEAVAAWNTRAPTKHEKHLAHALGEVVCQRNDLLKGRVT